MSKACSQETQWEVAAAKALRVNVCANSALTRSTGEKGKDRGIQRVPRVTIRHLGEAGFFHRCTFVKVLGLEQAKGIS